MPEGLGLAGSGPPDFVNAEGHKWWADKSSTRYAQEADLFGTKLNVFCFLVEFKEGGRVYVMIDGKTNEPVYEAASLEALGAHIDIMKVAKRGEQR